MSRFQSIRMKAWKFVQHLLLTALIFLAIFLPLVTNWESDLKFVLCLMLSYWILVVREHFGFLLPAYWSSSLATVLFLPFFYRNIPELLKNTALLSLLRAWHVGLLTSRSGYATDITLFRSNKLLTASLVFTSLVSDVSVTFATMKLFGYSTEASALMAAISPAPSPEVALPLFDFMSSSCIPSEDDLKPDSESEAKRARLEKYRKELTDTLKVFKTTALPLILITIAAFCAIVSGVDLHFLADGKLVVEIMWRSVALNSVAGIGAALGFSAAVYIVGSFLVAKDISPHAMASLLVCVGSLSMFYFGFMVPVASALAAIWGCLCLRLSTGFNERASSILSMFWPYTSHLYYSTFAYGVVGYYSLNETSLIKEHLWGILLGSAFSFLVKLFALTLVSRMSKISWLPSLTLALSLCSKGTVQIALSVIILLKIDIKGKNEVLTDVCTLQLFVLLNYLCLLPLIYLGTRLIARCIKR